MLFKNQDKDGDSQEAKLQDMLLRGSYMGEYVLLNLLNELRKGDKMRGKEHENSILLIT